jgi:hypothetical protein
MSLLPHWPYKAIEARAEPIEVADSRKAGRISIEKFGILCWRAKYARKVTR